MHVTQQRRRKRREGGTAYVDGRSPSPPLPPMGPKRDRGGGGGGKSGLSFSLLASSFPLVFANVMIR